MELLSVSTASDTEWSRRADPSAGGQQSIKRSWWTSSESISHRQKGQLNNDQGSFTLFNMLKVHFPLKLLMFLQPFLHHYSSSIQVFNNIRIFSFCIIEIKRFSYDIIRTLSLWQHRNSKRFFYDIKRPSMTTGIYKGSLMAVVASSCFQIIYFIVTILLTTQFKNKFASFCEAFSLSLPCTCVQEHLTYILYFI